MIYNIEDHFTPPFIYLSLNSGFGLFSDLLSQTFLGQTFLNITTFSRLNQLGGEVIKRIKNQIQTISLKKDRILPAEMIKKTLKGTHIIELDFPYAYSHELPFPIGISTIDTLIDKAFFRVFRTAALFLSR